MITVYIASQNTDAGMKAADRLRSLGYLPFWPIGAHFSCLFFPLSADREMREEAKFLESCDVLLRLETLSAGHDWEVSLAKSLNIPVFYSIESLVENLPADGEIVSMDPPCARGAWTLHGTIANPEPRPFFWRDPFGWLKWRPEVVWTDGEKITAEDWNRMIEGTTMPSPGIHPPASPIGGKTDPDTGSIKAA